MQSVMQTFFFLLSAVWWQEITLWELQVEQGTKNSREYKYEGIFTSWELIMGPMNKYLNSIVSTMQ